MARGRNANSLARYERAKELKAGGTTLGEACKQAGISNVTWYRNQKLEAKATRREAKTAKQPKFIDLVPHTNVPQNVAIVICSPEQVRSVIAGLR